MAIPALQSYSIPSEWAPNKVKWTLDPSRAVLLIHDMQAYFADFWEADSAFVQYLVERLAAVRAQCKLLGIPVVYTAQPGVQSDAERALLNDMWGPGITQHPERQAIIAGLAPKPDDTILVKWRYSAFQRSPLEHMLKELGRDQLIIGGIYAHIGCLMTACDAFMRDIQPFVLADGVADFNQADHQMALNYVATRCGQVIRCSDVLSLGGAAPALTRATLQARLLSLLDERGGKMTTVALARALSVQEVRMRGLLVKVQQLLNVDGYSVMIRDEVSNTVEFNRELLLRQFDLIREP